jgi:hypothetical protein
MTGWMTHLLAFLVGAAIGGFLMANRRSGYVQRRSGKILSHLYSECPEFFEGLRDEMAKPGFQGIREFAIVDSSRDTFVSEDVRFVFYADEVPKLKNTVEQLEEHGFIDGISRGRIPLYRMRETFLTALSSL